MLAEAEALPPILTGAELQVAGNDPEALPARLHTKPHSGQDPFSFLAPPMFHVADHKPVSSQAIDSSAPGLSDMDACWIKVMEPDSLGSAMQLADRVHTLEDHINGLQSRLDSVLTCMDALRQQNEVLIHQVAGLQALTHEHLPGMAAQTHEQHAYLMARRNKKAKTVKYVLS